MTVCRDCGVVLAYTSRSGRVISTGLAHARRCPTTWRGPGMLWEIERADDGTPLRMGWVG